MKPLRSLSLSSLFLVLAACGNEAPRALGTLEWDRITLPSPAAEKIVGIESALKNPPLIPVRVPLAAIQP